MDRAGLAGVFAAAVAALEPSQLVDAALSESRPDSGDLPVTVLGLGKAAAGMAHGLARHFTDLRGVVVTADPAEMPPGVSNLVGSHPVPDASSVTAGEALLAAATEADRRSLAVCLLSGGGSALAEVPASGVTVEEIAEITSALLRSGASIDELNAVRVALSQLKGGGLAAACSARLVTLAISDVAPLGPEVIASGPTLAWSGADAVTVLQRHGLWDIVGSGVRKAAARPPRSRSGDEFRVVADGALAATAAAAAVDAAGLRPILAAHNLSGEARDEARRVVETGAPPGSVSIYWGETTVTVRGSGRGGRNHEAALSAAIALDGEPGVFLAGGTDGIDGTSGFAGAVVDGETIGEAQAAGLDPAAHLDQNDSAAFFDVVSGRLDTGPTGTNVADLWLFAAT